MKSQKIYNVNKLLLLLTITFVFLAGCQKEINKEASRNDVSNKVITNSKSLDHESSTVATDWYKLMLRMILNANLPTPPRSYSSFDAAALECGKSRFYGGIHYLPSIEKSHQYGISIGDDAANLQLIK